MIRHLTGAHTEFPELAVGDDQGAQGPETLQGFIAILPCRSLVDWRTRNGYGLGIKLLGLPNKVLE